MNIPRKAFWFIAALTVTASFVLYYLIQQFSYTFDWKMLVFWSILGAITESLLILLPSGVGVSVGFAISLAAIITGGPLIGTLSSAISFILRMPNIKGRGIVHIFNTPPHKTLFNVSQSVISTAAAGIIYISCGGVIGQFSPVSTLVIIPVYVLLNSAMLSSIFALLSNQRFSSTWINNIKGVLISSVAVAIIGIIISLAYIAYGAIYGPITVLLFFAPLLLARYSFKLYVDMRTMYMETIQALNKTMEAKDPYTSGHALRVQEYAVKLAEVMALPEKKIQNIKTAAILHDIGKIGIDDSILKKPGSLTKEEYLEIQKHSAIGAEILKDVDFLKEIAQIIRYHHERFDGKGYPNGLFGEQIPIEASILAIADVYDAMTSNRPYRNALDKATALQEIITNAGRQFDPALAQKFYDMMSA